MAEFSPLCHGSPGTSNFCVTLTNNAGREVSPWHGVPFRAASGAFHVVCATPEGAWADCHVATQERLEPLRHCLKKTEASSGTSNGSADTWQVVELPRPSPWNCGIVPQTSAARRASAAEAGLPSPSALNYFLSPETNSSRESGISSACSRGAITRRASLPATPATHAAPSAAASDGPVEVVEIGGRARAIGEVYAVEAVAAMGVQDRQSGRLLWTVVAVARDDAAAPLERRAGDRYQAGRMDGGKDQGEREGEREAEGEEDGGGDEGGMGVDGGEWEDGWDGEGGEDGERSGERRRRRGAPLRVVLREIREWLKSQQSSQEPLFAQHLSPREVFCETDPLRVSAVLLDAHAAWRSLWGEARGGRPRSASGDADAGGWGGARKVDPAQRAVQGGTPLRGRSGPLQSRDWEYGQEKKIPLGRKKSWQGWTEDPRGELESWPSNSSCLPLGGDAGGGGVGGGGGGGSGCSAGVSIQTSSADCANGYSPIPYSAPVPHSLLPHSCPFPNPSSLPSSSSLPVSSFLPPSSSLPLSSSLSSSTSLPAASSCTKRAVFGSSLLAAWDSDEGEEGEKDEDEDVYDHGPPARDRFFSARDGPHAAATAAAAAATLAESESTVVAAASTRADSSSAHNQTALVRPGSKAGRRREALEGPGGAAGPSGPAGLAREAEGRRNLRRAIMGRLKRTAHSWKEGFGGGRAGTEERERERERVRSGRSGKKRAGSDDLSCVREGSAVEWSHAECSAVGGSLLRLRSHEIRSLDWGGESGEGAGPKGQQLRDMEGGEVEDLEEREAVHNQRRSEDLGAFLAPGSSRPHSSHHRSSSARPSPHQSPRSARSAARFFPRGASVGSAAPSALGTGSLHARESPTASPTSDMQALAALSQAPVPSLLPAASTAAAGGLVAVVVEKARRCIAACASP
ncbi:unnamed protein product, partial [Closterium sp. Naga37s-1]